MNYCIKKVGIGSGKWAWRVTKGRGLNVRVVGHYESRTEAEAAVAHLTIVAVAKLST